MMKTLLAVLLSVLPLAAQGVYSANKKTSLSGTAEVITVQLGASASKWATFQAANVYCSVDCEFTVEVNGTAATATTLATTKLKPTYPASTASAYSSSDAGVGTVIGRHAIQAGGTVSLDLRDVGIAAGGNLTIRTSAITGTAIVNVKWMEG